MPRQLRPSQRHRAIAPVATLPVDPKGSPRNKRSSQGGLGTIATNHTHQARGYGSSARFGIDPAEGKGDLPRVGGGRELPIAGLTTSSAVNGHASCEAGHPAKRPRTTTMPPLPQYFARYALARPEAGRTRAIPHTRSMPSHRCCHWSRLPRSLSPRPDTTACRWTRPKQVHSMAHALVSSGEQRDF